MPEYTIRRFRDGDFEGYRSLYRDVFGSQPADDWFQWKYRDNPYADHVPIYVAETDGEIVGARSFFALPLRTARDDVLAFQPCDTMVHEDHRRRGLFTRMTEAAIDGYRDGEPALFFNFPNSRTRAGNRKLGWRIVREKELWYRLQDPAAVAQSMTDNDVIRLAATAAGPAIKGYGAARGALATHPGASADGIAIERCEKVPAERLAALYQRSSPDAFHVPRDDGFLRWRFRNPDWAYRTYVASSGGDDVAAIVTGTRTLGNGLTKTTVVDVLSADGDRAAEIDRLLTTVLSDNRSTDLIVAMTSSIRREMLLNRGFLPDSRPPLDPVTETTTLMVRSLAGDEGAEDIEGDNDNEVRDAWTLDGRAIDEPQNWKTTFVSHDTD